MTIRAMLRMYIDEKKCGQEDRTTEMFNLMVERGVISHGQMEAYLHLVNLLWRIEMDATYDPFQGGSSVYRHMSMFLQVMDEAADFDWMVDESRESNEYMYHFRAKDSDGVYVSTTILGENWDVARTEAECLGYTEIELVGSNLAPRDSYGF